MHVPWIATIDALIAALRAERDFSAFPDGARSIDPDDVQFHLMHAIFDLERVRNDIRLIAVRLAARDPVNDRALGWTAALDDHERRMIRYPEQEGREGLARIVEQGGLFGPVFGAHIAAVIRGEHKLTAGTQSTFDEGRKRRYAVKQIMTIAHLYDISVAAAIRSFAEITYPDDPEEKNNERLKKWVQRLQAEARKELSRPELLDEDARGLQAFLTGLRPDLPRGFLLGQTYPGGMDSLPPRPR